MKVRFDAIARLNSLSGGGLTREEFETLKAYYLCYSKEELVDVLCSFLPTSLSHTILNSIQEEKNNV